jgi:hypothetical protein
MAFCAELLTQALNPVHRWRPVIPELLSHGHQSGFNHPRDVHKQPICQVGQGGIEPPTPAFSGLRSTD